MATSDSIVLHVEASWSSPWVCAVHVALREKAIPFTTSLAHHGSTCVPATAATAATTR